MKTRDFNIAGMCCNMCITKINKALEVFPQLQKVELQFDAPQMRVFFKEDVSDVEIIDAVDNAGHYFASTAQ